MSIEEILKEALKYDTRTAFKKGNRKAYKAAKKLEIYEQAVAHMKTVCRCWTEKDLTIEALKYKTRNEFNKGSSSAYQIAHSRKILNLICAHMPKRTSMAGEKNPNYKWSNQDLARIALKHRFRKEFSIKDGGAYQMANDRGILDEICKHMKNGNSGENNSNFYITDQLIKETALLFSNPAEFKKYHPSIYAAARNRRLTKEVFAHMTYLTHRPYTKEEVIKLAFTCNNRQEFSKKYSGAYSAAVRMNIMNDVTAHMSKSKSVSHMETELFLAIKKIYPNARKLADYNVNILRKPYIKRFHLDIYIPELNRAIEFDGRWWHSFECMRKQKHKNKWTDHDIRHYSSIKDRWFLSARKIKILHVKEENWRKNKEICIKKCLDFLKS